MNDMLKKAKAKKQNRKNLNLSEKEGDVKLSPSYIWRLPYFLFL